MIDTIRNVQGESLDFTYSPAEDGHATVIIGHGVTANKDRAWAVALHDALQAAGFGAFRFSFSGNGASEGDFRDSTIHKEVSDLGSVLDELQRAGIRFLAYAGHSMGGAVGVLRAAIDPRIRALVSLAGMVHTADFAERKFAGLTPGKDLMWDKPECPLSRDFLDVMQEIDSVLPRASSLRCPWLLVHGTDDTVVPHDESSQIATAVPIVKQVSMDGADHLFTGHETQMAEHVVVWLRDVMFAVDPSLPE
ncbi:MAG: alpha/beta fold hydrolase [Acidobacteriota bacterium]|nr:alpha/beta fold hydrolase [Acidobacteriota bacterium]MDH3784033.1 alpha/beta fold hydrolase [Acidobacteriota bacterium]